MTKLVLHLEGTKYGDARVVRNIKPDEYRRLNWYVKDLAAEVPKNDMELEVLTMMYAFSRTDDDYLELDTEVGGQTRLEELTMKDAASYSHDIHVHLEPQPKVGCCKPAKKVQQFHDFEHRINDKAISEYRSWQQERMTASKAR